MADVKPTRTELLKLKKRAKLAKSGHSLLKRKRDGLIQELFKVLEKARKSSSKINQSYNFAQRKIELARALDGTLNVKSAAFANTEDPNITVRSKTIMGVTVPEISSQKEHFVKEFHERGYGMLSTTGTIDKAARAYEELISQIIVLAEIETTLKKMLAEIEKTKRRVNALEFNLIPKMQQDVAFINLHLEEMEREDVFRLKRFKQKKNKQESS